MTFPAQGMPNYLPERTWNYLLKLLRNQRSISPTNPVYYFMSASLHDCSMSGKNEPLCLRSGIFQTSRWTAWFISTLSQWSVAIHDVSKNMSYIIFDDNLNRHCPITIIFGKLIIPTMDHRKLISFSHIAYLVQLSYRGTLANRENQRRNNACGSDRFSLFSLLNTRLSKYVNRKCIDYADNVSRDGYACWLLVRSVIGDSDWHRSGRMSWR